MFAGVRVVEDIGAGLCYPIQSRWGREWMGRESGCDFYCFTGMTIG